MNINIKIFIAVFCIVFSIGQIFFHQSSKEIQEEKPNIQIEEKKPSDNVLYVASEEFYKIIGEKIKYPKKARELGIEGRINVFFQIDERGKIENIRVNQYNVQGVRLMNIFVISYNINMFSSNNFYDLGLLEGEVKRAMNEMEAFILKTKQPLLNKMNAYTLPIHFKLN